MLVAVLPAILPLGDAFPLCTLQSQLLEPKGCKSVPNGSEVGDGQQTAGTFTMQPGRALQSEDNGAMTCFIHITQPEAALKKNELSPMG